MKQNFSQIINILLPFVISFILLFYFKGKVESVAFEDLALKEGTSQYYTSINNRKIHCGSLTLEPISVCMHDFQKFNNNEKYKIMIWLGNSQLHAVNQRKDDDKTASLLVHEKMLNQNFYTITLSQPNANLEEHYLITAYLATNYNIDTIILPLVFDDFRETGVRKDLINLLLDKLTNKSLNNNPAGKELLKLSPKNSKDYHLRDYSENMIEQFLNMNFDLWSLRKYYRGELFFSLYKIRNWLFNITPKTTRKILRGPYNRNYRALIALLNLAQEKKIRVFGYIAPLRQDVTPPYEMQEYKEFLKSIDELSKFKIASFVNFDSIVPPYAWGMKESTTNKENLELDFMHFSALGHKYLANNVLRFIIGSK